MKRGRGIFEIEMIDERLHVCMATAWGDYKDGV